MFDREGALQKVVLEFLQLAYPNALIIRTNSGQGKTLTGSWVWFVRWWCRSIVSGEQHDGVCDIHLSYLGRFVAIERFQEEEK